MASALALPLPKRAFCIVTSTLLFGPESTLKISHGGGILSTTHQLLATHYPMRHDPLWGPCSLAPWRACETSSSDLWLSHLPKTLHLAQLLPACHLTPRVFHRPPRVQVKIPVVFWGAHACWEIHRSQTGPE